MATVAVLIPFFNRSELIYDSIRSVVQPDADIILFDDGSTDGGIDLNNVDAMDRRRIRLIKSHCSNRGVGASRNELLKIALKLGYEYFAWQDSDDISHHDRIGLQLDYLRETKSDICFTDMYFFNHPLPYYQTRTVHKIDISKYINREGLFQNTNFATALFTKRVASVLFDEHLRRKEDINWLMKLIKMGVTFSHLPIPLYYCRRHPGRLTYENSSNN